jgi:hypothetical protein
MKCISLDPRLMITSLLFIFRKITKYENGRNEKNNTIHTKMNIRYIIVNPIWARTHIEGETYALFSFVQLWKCIHKERGTHPGVFFDIVAYMDSTKYFPPLL